MTQKELELIQLAHTFNNPWFAFLFAVLVVWTITWKGIALWKAVKNNSKAWYVIMLVLNTVGILEIIYIFFFSKKKENSVK
jgi:methionyl-tRNA synthetase